MTLAMAWVTPPGRAGPAAAPLSLARRAAGGGVRAIGVRQGPRRLGSGLGAAAGKAEEEEEEEEEEEGEGLKAAGRRGLAASASSSGMGAKDVQRDTLFLRTSVRSGVEVRHPGSVVVLGDVSRGAEIVAGGDIVVWGKLRGIAQAGANGDASAFILAGRMQPSQLHIAGRVAIGPDGVQASQPYAEVASLTSDGKTIAIAPANGATLPVASPGGRLDLSESPTAGFWFPQQDEYAMGATSSGGGPTPLSRAAKAAIFTGCYIGLAGLCLLAAPDRVFSILFDPAGMTPGWVQVLGALCVVFGIYYVGAGFNDQTAFFYATVFGRIFLFFTFAALVALQVAEATLLLLGAVNLLGAASMFVALRRDLVLGVHPPAGEDISARQTAKNRL